MDTLVEYDGGGFNPYFFQFAISLFLKFNQGEQDHTNRLPKFTFW